LRIDRDHHISLLPKRASLVNLSSLCLLIPISSYLKCDPPAAIKSRFYQLGVN
jgi:hypothetical protein